MSRLGTSRQNRVAILTVGVYSWSLHRVSPRKAGSLGQGLLRWVLQDEEDSRAEVMSLPLL